MAATKVHMTARVAPELLKRFDDSHGYDSRSEALAAAMALLLDGPPQTADDRIADLEGRVQRLEALFVRS